MYALLLVALIACGQPPAAPGAKRPLPDQATLDQEFAEMLSGATLTGSFTDDKAPDAELRTDRYRIDKVTKLKNDYWLFESTVEYDGKSIPIKIPLEVRWAGDTAVITLTDLFFPGLGTFTARVLVYRGQYAGTWRGADHGGHLFGTIEKSTEEPAHAPDKDQADPAEAPPERR